MAQLLHPKNDKSRDEVRRVLLAADLRGLEKDLQLEPEKGQLLEGIKADLVSSISMQIRHGADRNHNFVRL
jgi:hypothetical protein